MNVVCNRAHIASGNSSEGLQGKLSRLVNIFCLYGIEFKVILRLEGQLEKIERNQSISTRWHPSDIIYKENEFVVLQAKREHLLLEIWKASQKRMFLLKLKMKYAG